MSLVVGAGLLVVGDSLHRVFIAPPGIEWFILAALTLLTGSFTVKLPSLPAKISVSETFVFTSVLLFGPAAGTLTVVLDALVISFWMTPAKRPPLRVLFNATAPAIAIRVASEIFFMQSRVLPGTIDRTDVGGLVLPLFAFAFLYFLINTGLVAGVLALERRESPIDIWRRHFPQVSTTYFVGGSIALLLVAYTDTIDLTVLSIIVPLLVISYLTFRTSMGRIEDANRHVEQVQEMFLSTVETLAMAVDAKDQITHGHIRRVQTRATDLARRMGVTEDVQLKAVATAALLHDMGKLAIPEHILNKPGKLTSAEFSKMKRHADIGADLLSSIRFPFPVVPIVRHHHENWDGSGYPSGISGADIPIGARVLAVVDCFDALTSDRPYRPRLSSEEAFDILRERRGTMYDPLVVDTFISSYAGIAQDSVTIGRSETPLTSASDIRALELEESAFNQIRATAAESTLLVNAAEDIAAATSPGQALASAAQCLRQLLPATVFCLYRYDPADDNVKCDFVEGDPKGLLVGLSIKVGERVTGWTVANRHTSVNSHAALDLSHIAESFETPLRSTISTPMFSGSRMLGALTAYSSKTDAFVESDRYTFERIASLIATSIATPRGRALVAFPDKRSRTS